MTCGAGGDGMMTFARSNTMTWQDWEGVMGHGRHKRAGLDARDWAARRAWRRRMITAFDDAAPAKAGP